MRSVGFTSPTRDLQTHGGAPSRLTTTPLPLKCKTGGGLGRGSKKQTCSSEEELDFHTWYGEVVPLVSQSDPLPGTVLSHLCVCGMFACHRDHGYGVCSSQRGGITREVLSLLGRQIWWLIRLGLGFFVQISAFPFNNLPQINSE